MRKESFNRIINSMSFVTLFIISHYIKSIFLNVSIIFLASNILLLCIELLECKFYKNSNLFIVIEEIKQTKDKKQKAVDIITLIFPSILQTVLILFISHLVK